jgi:hypothetical protein
MSSVGSDSIESLRERIFARETQLSELRLELAEAESQNLLQPWDGLDDFDALTFGVPDTFRNEVLVALDSRTLVPPTNQLWDNDHERPQRQILTPEMVLQWQLALNWNSVLIVGLSGLGCTIATYLSRACTHTIGLMDGGNIKRSNLHRQTLLLNAKEGESKVESAVRQLKRYVVAFWVPPHPLPKFLCLTAPTSLNNGVQYITHKAYARPGIDENIFRDYECIIDCSNSFNTQTLLSRVCLAAGRQLITGVTGEFGEFGGSEGHLVLNNALQSQGYG